MGVGGSYSYGKVEIATFIHDRFPFGSYILDVGAGGGTYGYYLGVGYNLEAVELWPESIQALQNAAHYTKVHAIDIRDFKYEHDYDLIIFGDVLEHLTISDAQRVLQEAEKHTKYILIGVPYMLPQEAIYGNVAEEHLQPDLTPTNFKERYPGYYLLMGRNDLYGYYCKDCRVKEVYDDEPEK